MGNMELLAPAGNMEKLETAVRFGADAVYCAAGPYSLRAPETSFTVEQLARGIDFAHSHNCKVYLAMNIFAFDSDLEGMISYFQKAVELGIDAVIVSDPGVLARIQQLGTGLKVHLSTQANTTNSDSAAFWYRQGVKRIIAARELSLQQIKAIKENVPGLELEILAHGAMCIAYSGRCLLSKFMTNRSANRGQCTQPCRWEYFLRERGRREEQTIGADQRGTYILNSRDLCMVEHIPEIAAAGINSIKIEGRMKSAYYVAAVTRIYRQALDSFHDSPASYTCKGEWLEELEKVSHRPYTTGFYFSGNQETEYTTTSANQGEFEFVGVVDGHDRQNNRLRVLGRNRFSRGDLIEILDPGHTEIRSIKVPEIISQSGERLEDAHNGYVVDIPLPENFPGIIGRHALIRKKRLPAN